MNKLIDKLSESVNTKSCIINSRLAEFKKINRHSINEVFNELCFCLMTANFNAERAIKIQKELGNQFMILSEEKLAKRLKELGHRHPNVRAKYITEARALINDLLRNVKSMNELELREWLVNNVNGLGYKEASHFMRNIGYDNVAIIDFHIIDLLEREGIITKPKTLNKKNYLLIENKLREISKETSIPLSGLDLHLWNMETGKILK